MARRRTLAERLIAMEATVSRRDIAARLRIVEKSVLNLERGAMPRLDTAYHAARLLGITVDEIAAEFSREALAGVSG